MMNNKKVFSLPNHLIDHDYFLPVEYEDELHEEEVVEELEELVKEEEEKVEEVEELEEEEDQQIVKVSETYRLIPGIHNRSRIYVDNIGFKYYKREIIGQRVYLVCERQKNGHQFCPSTATVSVNLLDNKIHLLHYHDHQPKVIDLNVPFLREAVTEILINPIYPAVTTSFMRIMYNKEITNHPEAALNYTFTQARKRVKKMRRRRFRRT